MARMVEQQEGAGRAQSFLKNSGGRPAKAALHQDVEDLRFVHEDSSETTHALHKGTQAPVARQTLRLHFYSCDYCSFCFCLC